MGIDPGLQGGSEELLFHFVLGYYTPLLRGCNEILSK